MRASILLLALAGAVAIAQDTTTTGDTTAAATTTTAKSTATSASSATDDSADNTSAIAAALASTATSSASSTKSSSSTTDGSSSTTDTASGTTTSGSSSSKTSSSVFHLSSLPTIAGASIPTIVIPYTAAAPFMQKSSYPEGTVFICVGAVLGFLGLCVLAWRAMVAYAINRSVKRAALASIMASDAKAPGWLAGGIPMKKGPGGKMYRQPTDNSSMSLEPLNAHGKRIDPYANTRRASAVPTRKEQKRDPTGLFFSPTAAPSANNNPGNRSSTYLPAGYYASAGGQTGGRSSPPESPAKRPATSHLRAPSYRDTDRSSWASSTPNRNSAPLLTPTYLPGGSSGLYSQPSTSSLAVGYGHGGDENLPGQRAPSAYFDDVLEEHGHGSRERL